MRNRLLPLLVFALALVAAPVAAQVVRGTLTVPGGGPEPGVTVQLIDSTGEVARQTLSGPSGYYGFVAPSAGRFRVRVIRLGFADWETDPFQLRGSETLDLNAELPGVRPAPPDLKPTRKCETYASDGAASGLLREVRKVLQAADGFLRESDYKFDVRAYAKVLDANYGQVAYDTASAEHSDFWPVKSLPVERLQAGGFIQGNDPRTGPVYYGPDAEVLFSDFFLQNHCFEIVQGKKDLKGLVGVHFKPATTREQADIDGDLWVDPATLGLKRLEFGYTNMPSWAPRKAAGGVLDFERLPSGYWTVIKWRMWAPIPEQIQGSNWFNFLGTAEEGGEITKVTLPDGKVVYAADSGSGK